MNKILKISAALVLPLLIASIQGCAPSSYIVKTPTPSNVTYKTEQTTPKAVNLVDGRVNKSRPFSSGILPAALLVGKGKPLDPIPYLKENIDKELAARGTPIVYQDSVDSLELKVNNFHMTNYRSNAFSPFVTFTYLSADINLSGSKKRLATFIRRGKVPVWTFDEIIDPTLNEPLDLAVKELSAKISRALYNAKVSDQEVDNQITQLKNEKNPSYLDVYQLGFSNNERAIPFMVELTTHKEEYIRLAAISSLGTLNAVDQISSLKDIYANSAHWHEKGMALKALGDIGTEETITFLKEKRQEFSGVSTNEAIWNNEIINLYLNDQ